MLLFCMADGHGNLAIMRSFIGFKRPKLEQTFTGRFPRVTSETGNGSLHDIYFWYIQLHIFEDSTTEALRWTGHLARMEEGRSAFKNLTGTPAGNRPLGRPRRRQENIRIDLEEIGINTRNLADSAQDRD